MRGRESQSGNERQAERQRGNERQGERMWMRDAKEQEIG